MPKITVLGGPSSKYDPPPAPPRARDAVAKVEVEVDTVIPEPLIAEPEPPIPPAATVFGPFAVNEFTRPPRKATKPTGNA